MTQHPSSFAKRLGMALVAAGLLSLYSGSLSAQRSAPSLPKADAWSSMHLLNRISFGPRPGDLERVQKMGLAAYIEEQLHPEKIDNAALDTRLSGFTTLAMDSQDITEKFIQPAQQLQRQRQQAQGQANPQRPAAANANTGDPTMNSMTMDAPARPQQPQLSAEERMIRQGQAQVVDDLMQGKVIRAVESNRQLEEVLTDFWFNHFNVYMQKGQVRNYITEYEREAIRPYVLGKFRDMLGATAHSPAMLFYLDNFQSSTANTEPVSNPEMMRRLSNPRLAPTQRQQMQQRLQQAQRQQGRGLNENYARELMELHTLGVDGGYTQQDVQEVARALTGWTIDRPQAGGGFAFRPQMHDSKSKTILGVKFDGKGGQDEGERVLDILAKHPSTAHHIAYKLSQRFVADEPPKSLVDRAAKVFLDTKGDLREVTRTIITSPEFFDSDAYRAKVKTPFEFVISAIRATGATVTNAQPIVAQLRGPLGMPLYGCQPPTGYSMTADAWVNTGALLNRMNFAVSLVGDGGRGMLAAAGPGRNGQPAPPQRPNAPGPGRGGRGGQQALQRGPLQVDLDTLAPDVTEASRDRLIGAMLAGRASDGTMKTLARAEAAAQLVALTLGSPEFQKR
jgi:uncharacterized protein (DUF1800 family)